MLDAWMGIGALVGFVMFVIMQIDFGKRTEDSNLPPSLQEKPPSFILFMIMGIIGGPIFAILVVYMYIKDKINQKEEEINIELERAEIWKKEEKFIQDFITDIENFDIIISNPLSIETSENIYKLSLAFQKIQISKIPPEILRNFQNILIFGRKGLYTVFPENESKKSDKIAKNLSKSLSIISKFVQV